jgi:hypothetical protein
MTAWGDLIDAGYSRVLGLAIEGVPYAFLETRLLTTADVDIASPSGVSIVRGALRVRESDAISSELDRVAGLARGRSVDFVLALDVLAANSVTLFRQPTKRAKLTGDLDGTATTVTVDSTTGWDVKGSFYLGRERIDYDGTTPTAFQNCVRAVAGWAHYHPSSTASGYRFATDTPLYWRGRLVTLYEHLVGPDGRALAATANTVGSYCRELWKGYVDAQPQVDGRQMLLRALPVHRLLAQQLGGTAKGEVQFTTVSGGLEQSANALGLYPVYLTSSDRIFLSNTVTGDAKFCPVGNDYASKVVTLSELGRWVTEASLYAAPALNLAYAQHTVVDVDEANPEPVLRFQFRANTPASYNKEDIDCVPYAWFFRQRTRSTARVAIYTGFNDRFDVDQFELRFDPNGAPSAWVIVRKDLENDGEPLAWPVSGYVLLEAEEGLEVAAYDQKDEAVDPDGQFLAVRLSQRALMGTTRVNPWTSPTKITVLPGQRGTLSDVIRTIATSSGTGERGVYDTLPFGMGLALPDTWLDVNRFPLTAQYVDGISDDKASVENIVGGWLALQGYCLTQRQGSDGYVRIEAVATSLDTPGVATQVGPGDVLIGGTQAERLFETPNVVRIEDSLRQRKTVSVVRDVPRQQAEGARSVTVIAPGISTASALIYGGKMLGLSDGQLVVTLPVRSGLDLHVGDPCRLVLSHPAIWDWVTGEVSADTPARVIGEHESLGDGTRKLTFMVTGQQRRPRVLCPAARVTGWLSSTVVQVDSTVGFAAGHKVRVYRRGDDTTFEDRIISAVNSSTVLTLTVGATTATFPADGDSWLTYDTYTDCVSTQQAHLFVRTDQEFEA